MPELYQDSSLPSDGEKDEDRESEDDESYLSVLRTRNKELIKRMLLF